MIEYNNKEELFERISELMDQKIAAAKNEYLSDFNFIANELKSKFGKEIEEIKTANSECCDVVAKHSEVLDLVQKDYCKILCRYDDFTKDHINDLTVHVPPVNTKRGWLKRKVFQWIND